MCGICVADHIVSSPVAGNDHAARLDRVRDQALLAVAALDRHLGARELIVDLAGRELPRVAVVRTELFVHERRALVERTLCIDDDRQWLVVDPHELRGVARRLPAVRDDDGNAVADVACFVDREWAVIRLVRLLRRQPRAGERGLPFVGEVGAGERGDHVAVRERARDIDALDARVRIRTAHDRHPHHAGQAHVVDVLREPGQQRGVLFSFGRRSDDAADDGLLCGGRHDPTSTAPAAACTARTMLW
jgi:hypothetical protein